MLTSRTLRAANAGFYLACTFFIIIACVYVMYTKEMTLSTVWAIVLASAGATLWGAYYATFCYRVNTVRISRISLFCTRHITWEEITGISYEEKDSGGVASYKITVASATRTFEISSDILSPDAVQELAADLREKGLLPPAESAQNS
jgi:hypothetical protein